MDKGIFKLKSDFKPSGDQPEAISALLKGLKKGMQKQTLLGATGTGKTFTMANVIAEVQKPTLIIAHNKTLAAQLAQEFKHFFPDNAVHYFVSYYDYYQPEAYIAHTDTYIEKDAQINKEIERLRHATTQALLTRKDVIIVASVSCIYGLGSPVEYEKVNLKLSRDMKITRSEIIERLVDIHFERTNADLSPGQFRALGNKVEIMPVSDTVMYSIELTGSSISSLLEIDPVTSIIKSEKDAVFLFPAKHFIVDETERKRAMKAIKTELDQQLKYFEKENKLLEAERLKRRTTYDLAMIREVGYCSGIENYSRHLSGKKPGEAPDTLLSYFAYAGGSDSRSSASSPRESAFLTIIDESHVTIPQIGAMYAGDQSRKQNLVEYGFRLPSAKDNRPLKFDEFWERVGQVIFTTATPAEFERTNSDQIVQQIIRPTGLVDPVLEVRPVIASNAKNQEPKTKNQTEDGENVGSWNLDLGSSYPGQVQDFINEAVAEIGKGRRVLATTLTKKMAEDLSAYLKERDIRAEYLHSDVETLDRIKILTRLRKGEFDCLVGVNLLREGLDLPEVSLIGILDADKEGFLRSETSLIQTIGRAARNVEGRVILYADQMTGSLERAMAETQRRREVQLAYNKKHGITPMSISKEIKDITDSMEDTHGDSVRAELALDLEVMKSMEADDAWKKPHKRANPLQKLIKLKEDEMKQAVKILDFETAAILRDELVVLRAKLPPEPKPRKLKKGETLL